MGMWGGFVRVGWVCEGGVVLWGWGEFVRVGWVCEGGVSL